ncbi:hypothetical protein Atai01_79640 [Amycolatopsis taiwanensis]|uniref:DUF4007 domain-containing protein n=2 Tax=Amycolatopsis taiwanensis TaxID=342230 RepID=A0A9W6VK55_9PSEU|nr:hypothetical protein Atai01_79640 [Amycolatopsis taiwanensis]
MVKDNPSTFIDDDAPVQLGVGKNMVNAMRYWSKAFKLTREHPSNDGKTKAHIASPTWEARWLLDEDGADPYLEEPGSLWLLHWWLVSSRPGAKCWAPTWYTAFHLAPFSRFTVADMTRVVMRHVNFSFPEGPVEASIAKDVDCLTKMYARTPGERAGAKPSGSKSGFEDLLACPFRELDLIVSVGTRGKPEWQFTTAARNSLPPRVLVYACLDYAARETSSAGSISLARLANEPGGPGRAFRVREPEIVAALDQIAAARTDLDRIDAVGQRSMSFQKNPFTLAWEILDEQYGHVTRRPGFPRREKWDAKYPMLPKVAKSELTQPVRKPLALIEEIA